MDDRDGKLSVKLKQMAERLLKYPKRIPSAEAANVSLFFATVAWNESLDPASDRDEYRGIWETIEADNPALWKELKSNDIDPLIDELIEFKQVHFASDQRRIVTCGIVDHKVQVQWLPPA